MSRVPYTMEAHICNVCRPIVVTSGEVEGAYTTQDANRAPKVGLGSVRWEKEVDTRYYYSLFSTSVNFTICHDLHHIQFEVVYSYHFGL